MCHLNQSVLGRFIAMLFQVLCYHLFQFNSTLPLSTSSFEKLPLCYLNHPSIFYTCLIRWSGRGRSVPAVIGQEAGYTLDRSPVHHWATQRQMRQATTHTLTRKILDTPINLTCMFLDGGRKPEYPERTHSYTGRTCISKPFALNRKSSSCFMCQFSLHTVCRLFGVVKTNFMQVSLYFLSYLSVQTFAPNSAEILMTQPN